MLPALALRTLRSADKRCIAKFVWNFGIKGMLSVERFKRRLKRGETFPPFLYLSIINSCNLRCQGCWVDVEEKDAIDLASLNRTIEDAQAHGNSFFGILGGEPFMHPQLLDLLAAHPDCYFQIFTNGQFITEKVAKRLREIGNCTPLISIEGREVVSDERRGKKDVLNKTLRGLDHCLKEGILTGVATSVCQTNIPSAQR
jgi:MoaA/NifB/PqqE/SkfB family radical SAM enzyme